jgi:predicted cupin superfamily sugar epimerase
VIRAGPGAGPVSLSVSHPGESNGRWWQTAVPLGAWALVGCTVSPAFEFDGVELAPADWEPLGREPPGGEAPSREAPS